MRHLMIFWLVALITMLPGMPVAAQSAPATIPIRPDPCRYGARAQQIGGCLVVPVLQAGRLVDATVIVSNGRGSVQARTEQLINQPANDRAAALDLTPLDLRVGELLDLQVNTADRQINRKIPFVPDPATLVQVLEPIVVDRPPSDRGAPIIGTVFQVDAPQQPLAEAEVVAMIGTRSYTVTTRLQGQPFPTFAFQQIDMSSLPANTPIRLRARLGTQSQEYLLSWQGSPFDIPIALNWPCPGDIGSRASGGGGNIPDDLPDTFCLVGYVQYRGAFVQQATVSVRVDDRVLETNLAPMASTGRSGFAIDLGALTTGYADDTPVEIVASQDDKVGFLRTTIGQLGVDQRWGTIITLSDAVGIGSGIPGGAASAVAVSGAADDPITWVGTSGGGLKRFDDTVDQWESVLAGELPLPIPDLSALYALPGDDSGTIIIAGLRNGVLAISADEGNTWQHTEPLGIGPILAITRIDTGIVVAGHKGMRLVPLVLGSLPSLDKQTMQTIQPPGQIRALAALASTLYAGGPQGLWQSLDRGATWAQLSTQALNGMAPIEGGLLLSNTTQVWRADLAGQQLGRRMNFPQIQGITAHSDGRSARLIASQQIYRASAPTWDWQPLSSAMEVPDLFDLALFGNQFYAGSSSGVYRSSDGLNWQQLTGTETQTEAVTQIAVGSNLVVFANSSGIWRLDPATNASAALVDGLPTPHNSSALAVSRDGQIMLVGRGSGPGPNVWMSFDRGSTWRSTLVGTGRAIHDIQFFDPPTNGLVAVISAGHDGLYGLMADGSVQAVGSLPTDATNRSVAIGKILIRQAGLATCNLLVSSEGVPARSYTRPCDTTSAWSAANQIGSSVASVVGFAHAPDGRVFAATTEGIFLSINNSTWAPIYGLPIRPMSLAVSPEYQLDRRLIVGGQQAGVVVLTDSTPDLSVRIEGGAAIKGSQQLTQTIVIQNIGIRRSAAANLDLSISPGTVQFDGAQTYPVPALQPGELFRIPLRLVATDATRPGEVTLRAELQSVAADIYAPNNQFERTIATEYRDGADPAVFVTGNTVANAQGSGVLYISVWNQGTQAITMPVDLELTLSVSATFQIAPLGQRGSTAQGIYRQRITSLDAGAARVFQLSYQRSAADQDDVLALTVRIGAMADREPNNNTFIVQIRSIGQQPDVVVFTNYPRMRELEPGSSSMPDLQRETNLFAAQPGVVVLPIEQLPPNCQGLNRTSLASLYRDLDAKTSALKQIAGQSSRNTAAFMNAVNAALQSRSMLNDAIELQIKQQLQCYGYRPTTIYLIGGDRIFPVDAVEEVLLPNQSNTREDRYAEDVPVDDPLYAVFAANRYPSYRRYRSIDNHDYQVAIQPGNIAAITQVLRSYNQNQGILPINRALVAGYAEGLTNDSQIRSCTLFRRRGLLLEDDCISINRDPQSIIKPLLSESLLTVVSEHSTHRSIGTLSSNHIITQSFQKLSFLIALGCHTALAPLNGEPSLAEAFGRHGMPMIGFLGYAYAIYDQHGNIPGYAEELVALMLPYVLNGKTLGEAEQLARDDYFVRYGLKGRHGKTLDTAVLYGPPTYRMLPVGLAAVQNTAAPSDELTITSTFTQVETVDGGYAQAQLNQGQSYPLIGDGQTVQPGGLVELSPTTNGILIRGGSYSETANANPLIVRVAPVGSAELSEPRYAGNDLDWADMWALRRDTTGRNFLSITLGQWMPNGQVQRLFRQLQFVQLTGDPNAAPPAPLPELAPCTCQGQMVRSSLPHRAGMTRVELVLFEQGNLRIVPMQRNGTMWQVSFQAAPGTQIMLQAAYDSGYSQINMGNGRPSLVPNCAP